MMRSRIGFIQHITVYVYNINTRLYIIMIIYSRCVFANKNHSEIRRQRALNVSHQNAGGGSLRVRTCYYIMMLGRRYICI